MSTMKTPSGSPDPVAWWADRIGILVGAKEVYALITAGMVAAWALGNSGTSREAATVPPPSSTPSVVAKTHETRIAPAATVAPAPLGATEANPRTIPDRPATNNAARIVSENDIQEACRDRVNLQMRFNRDPVLSQSSALNRARDACEQEMRLRNVERDQN
jgi:hypothetical protein